MIPLEYNKTDRQFGAGQPLFRWLSFLRAQGRVRKFAAKAARALRGEQGKMKHLYLIEKKVFGCIDTMKQN